MEDADSTSIHECVCVCDFGFLLWLKFIFSCGRTAATAPRMFICSAASSSGSLEAVVTQFY